MTISKTILAIGLFALGGCAGTTAPDTSAEPVILTTEAAFRAAIVGKTMGFDGSTFTVNADNTVSGPWDGSGITGTWSWEDPYWCRDIAIGGVDRGSDCQIWAVSGSSATVTRDRGNGSSFTYSLN